MDVMNAPYYMHGKEHYIQSFNRKTRQGEPLLGKNGRAILNWILKKSYESLLIGLIRFTVMASYEHDEASSGSVKCLEFLDYGLLRNSYLAA
jgi:hypothetical protein